MILEGLTPDGCNLYKISGIKDRKHLTDFRPRVYMDAVLLDCFNPIINKIQEGKCLPKKCAQ